MRGESPSEECGDSTGEPSEPRDFRAVRRTWDAVRRGAVGGESARARAIGAATSSNAALRAAGLDVVLALDESTPLAVLENYSLPNDALSPRGARAREGERFARLARADPAGVRPHVGDVVSAAVHRGDSTALSLVCGLAGRDPAVLKPRVESLVEDAGASDRVRWALARLGVVEPAVLRRHLANATWTIARAEDDPVPGAVRSMIETVAALGRDVPESVDYEGLLDHVDDSTRIAAMDGLRRLAAGDGRTPGIDWLDLPVVEGALVDAVRSESLDDTGVSARALGAVAARRPAAAPTAVRELVAGLTDRPTVVRGASSGLCTVVRAVPSERAPGTVRRVAARLGGDSEPAIAVALLETLAAHGRVTVDAIDLDVVAVLLGHRSEDCRRAAVGTLLDLGASALESRPAVVRYLRWARHDDAEGVRTRALAALGTAGELWPASAPTVVDALVAHLAEYPADATAVAAALRAVADETPAVGPAVVGRIVGRVESGELPRAVASECIGEFGVAMPEALDDAVDVLVEWATAGPDEVGVDASRALLALAEASPSAVAPHAAQLRAGFTDADASVAVRAPLAAALALVADERDAAEPTAWLADRTPEAPVEAGGALAVLARGAPASALPSLESVLESIEREVVREGAVDGDTTALVERVVEPLVGSHPAAGPPVVRALAAAVRDPEARERAAAVLRDALAEWPYLAPLATAALVESLDDAGGETLRHVVAPLSRVDAERADRALRALAAHPDADVRRAASARGSAPLAPPDAPDAEWIRELAPGDATREDVDRLARGLGTAAPVDSATVLTGLGAIARERPSLRAHVRCHVLGAVVADGSTAALAETVTAFADENTREDAMPSGANTEQVGSLSALATDADSEVVRCQATAALVATVRREPALATRSVSDHLHAAVDAESALVAGRALRGVRVLAADLPLDPFADATALESRLFRPPALIPRATWTVAVLARHRPDAVRGLAPSLSGVLDWTGLPRAHALRTIPDVLAAAPETEAALAPGILEQLRSDTPPTERVIDALGHLSGDAIATAPDGATRLLATLDEVDGGRPYALAADRLLRVAEADPEAVVRALEVREADALPPMRTAGLEHYLCALERAVAHGGDRIWYPFVDVGNVFDSHESVGQAKRWADTVDRDVARFDLGDAVASGRRVRRRLVAVLAESGHVEFLRVLGAYEDDGPAVEPTPAQVATWFALTTDEAASTATTALCNGADVDFVAAVGTLLAERLPSLPLEAARRVLRALPRFATAVPAGDGRRTMREALAAALDGDWALALSAVDAVADLGTREPVQASTALDLLLDRVDVSEPTMRRRLAEAVSTLCLDGDVDAASVRDRLAAMLDAEAASVDRRRASVLALGRLAAVDRGLREPTVSDLTVALSADEPGLRRAAVEELARVADEDAAAVVERVDAVAARLSDPERRVARAALECLRTIGEERSHTAPVAAALVRALASTGGLLRERCADALADVLTMDATLPDAVVDRLRDHLDDPHAGARAGVVRALSYVGTPADRGEIERTREDRPVLRAAVSDALRRLDARHDSRPYSSRDAGAPTGRYDNARTAARRGDVPRDAPTETWAFAPDWDDDATESAPASLAVVDDAVYVAGRTRIWAVEPDTGSVRWQYERAPVDESANRDGLGDLFGDGGYARSANASPTVADGTVYVAHPDSTAADVYALDAETGAERWVRAFDAGVDTTPAVVDDAVLVGHEDGTLSALDAADGATRWRFDTAAAPCSTPATDGTTAFVLAGGSHVHAVEPTEGIERWRVDLGDGDGDGNGHPPPAVRRDTAYVCPNGTGVVALDAADGDVRWRVDPADATGATAAVGPRRVLVGFDDGLLRAFDAADGSPEWSRRFAQHGRILPAVVGDRIAAANGVGSLHCLDAADGTGQWSTAVDAPLDATPVVVDRTVYTAEPSARVRAFR